MKPTIAIDGIASQGTAAAKKLASIEFNHPPIGIARETPPKVGRYVDSNPPTIPPTRPTTKPLKIAFIDDKAILPMYMPAMSAAIAAAYIAKLDTKYPIRIAKTMYIAEPINIFLISIN